MAKTPKKDEIEDVPTEADIRRGDDVLRRMLKTKPKPHKDMRVGKVVPYVTVFDGQSDVEFRIADTVRQRRT